MKGGTSKALTTALRASYQRLLPWKTDQRSAAFREFAGDLLTLWQDLGGVDNLSAQQRWLCERVVFLRRRCVEFEAAVLEGTPPPLTEGEYSNACNVLAGYLAKLGLQRQSRPLSLADILADTTDSPDSAAAAPVLASQPGVAAGSPSLALDPAGAGVSSEQ